MVLKSDKLDPEKLDNHNYILCAHTIMTSIINKLNSKEKKKLKKIKITETKRKTHLVLKNSYYDHNSFLVW